MKLLLAGQSFKFWLKAARPISFGQSVMPYILGALLGLSAVIDLGIHNISLGIFVGILGVIGVILAHAGMNLIDDYFDMKKGAVTQREELLEGGFRARLGKCAYLKDGSVNLDDLKRVAIFFLGLALAISAVIFALRGWEVLIFAGVTLVLGISYAGPPLRLSYRGFGELVIAFIFGPVLVTAASFLVSGQITALALFCSVPIGLLVANIVNIHAVMDYGPDVAANRKTLPIIMGSERAGVITSVSFVIVAQLSILLGILLGVLPLAALLIMLTYPLSFVFIRLAVRYPEEKEQGATGSAKTEVQSFTFKLHRWMGSYGNWEKYEKDGLAWFMARWITARNLVMQVTLVLALSAFTPWYLNPWF
jgi:1,4-dihydroxy-2-naphthoate octaprenyltransferase